MKRLERAGFFLIPLLVCLIAFWRAPLVWFRNDDFAWLGLPLEVNQASDLWQLLFAPKAQGTIRFLSERLFFLVFSSLFGLNAVPFRIWVMLTWFANLTLANLIAVRLTGSRWAGMLAALLWTTSVIVITPLIWASAYNEVLCAFFVLAAFYSRLRWLESGQRKWAIAEWAAYLAGFGALEVIVMYPAAAALHALCLARKRVWSTLPLFIPAALFSLAHTFLIPKTTSPIYAVAIDGRLPATFWNYFVSGFTAAPYLQGAMIAALLGFAFWKIRKGEFLAVFCLGWFVLFIAPMLPLPNHITDYYVTIPLAGLTWIAGWAITSAWRTGAALRILAIVLAGVYFVSSIREINTVTRWFQARTGRIRAVILSVDARLRQRPGSAFLLQDVDNALFQSGFEDEPFRLIRAQRVSLVPTSEKNIVARADLSGMSHYRISPAQALDLLDHGNAYVLNVAGEPRDVTAEYHAVLRADPMARRRDFVDVADPLYNSLLGPMWPPAERTFRWCPKRATVKLSGPLDASQRLYVTGYTPAAVLVSGPVTMRVLVNGRETGSAKLSQANQQFALDFPLPPDVVGQEFIEIAVEFDKALQEEGAGRELAMVFGTFGIH